jgi:deazaflavin-dependent oxidoreductase (nitroreductase family)
MSERLATRNGADATATAATWLFGREHIDRYLATDGAEGYDWRGTTILILTTTGRRSGKPRTHPLIYREYGDAYLVVASNGGAPEHPQWYRNLAANPRADVQIKGERFAAQARTAGAGERPAMWKHMTEVWPDYDAYQRKTDRQIPVVVLQRM